MRKTRKAAKWAGGRAASPARKASAPPKQVREGSKLARIVGLLRRPDGCTREEVMQAVKWPSVSLQQQAAAAGLVLKVRKVDGVNRYSAT